MHWLTIYTHQQTRWYVDSGVYPDNTPYIKLDGRPFRENNVRSILLRSTDVNDLMRMLFWVDAIRMRCGDRPLDLVIPYLPGARQDRLNDEGDRLFTLKSVAKEINARNFDRVVVVDPHSMVTPALLDRCQVVTASEVLLRWGLSECIGARYQAVIAPDGGAEKRAFEAAKALGVPLFHAWKSRDVSTGSISGFGCEPLPDVQRALVVDDICDGGGTFLGLRSVVPERVTLDLYVTHGLFTQGLKKLSGAFSRIITTDSVCDGDGGENIQLIPICEPLLRRLDT